MNNKKYEKLLTKYDNMLNENIIDADIAKTLYLFFLESSEIGLIYSEDMHVLEDKINYNFINGLARGLIDNSQIKIIAGFIHKINKIEYVRWYA